jgi:tRNA N6-adenosine threonylcarbamoyltransferase
MTSLASPVVMAIETSCDETAVAVLAGGRDLLASEIASQVALHQPHGGVVPEVASRSHLTQLKPMIEQALSAAGFSIEQIDAFAATSGPGLATSLMVGASAAKALAISLRKPYLAVNHLEGHLLSPFFGSEIRPSIGLIVSGGHTLLVALEEFDRYRVLGHTHDDAAGEAFDKVGKLLGLPYPGGPQIDRLAREGDPARFDFPRSMMHSGDFHFSFSGLKTSVRYLLPKLEMDEKNLRDICASFQEAAVDVLVAKTIAAAKATKKILVTVSGGVSCNSRLREKFRDTCEGHGIELAIADPKLCTDNAAMIAFVASEKFRRGESSPLTVDIDPNLRLVGAAG